MDPWEVGAPDPPVFVRWTRQTNLELCLRLIAEGRLKVDDLTTHTLSLADIEGLWQGYREETSHDMPWLWVAGT